MFFWAEVFDSAQEILVHFYYNKTDWLIYLQKQPQWAPFIKDEQRGYKREQMATANQGSGEC